LQIGESILAYLFYIKYLMTLLIELLERIRLHVPAKPLRFKSLFHLEQHRTSYGAYKLLNRVCALANDFSNRVDFFNTSLNSFKTTMR